ncbi:MAG: WecB/TagA/CpsF family glycosyltransferase [Candidatus Absconditabacteria bacterium]|nr:WecB/TagA/CpsF family glycosyltransferase [Candidatus Absconditabacteria bacterium]MDD3868044.1 WecB/TagA/CpsF family glycosyltransferase [Candidatus Absconditabacteria bacterium]MDD4714291.1 WecB/TagA/CpsF family glycosyltransferase [Candidatus Absconditabacteria bacterium]
MQTVLNKLYTGDYPQLVNDILKTYDEEGFCVINFLYFSNIVAQKLFYESKEQTEKQREYKKILLKADYLLPDGIAVQIFYYLATFFHRITSPRPRLCNMNGTDFTPYLLEEIKKKYGNQKIALLLYGAPPKGIEKAANYISRKGFNVTYYQDGYREFEREAAMESLEDYQDTINILLVGRSTPKIPLQELRTSRNYQKIKKNNLVVMNVGGLFDRWSGDQKRSPKLVRKIKLERLWRFISQPKRNFKKVMNSLMVFPYIFHYLVLKKT